MCVITMERTPLPHPHSSTCFAYFIINRGTSAVNKPKQIIDVATEMASHFRASTPTPPQNPAWKLQPGICKLELIGGALFTLKTQTRVRTLQNSLCVLSAQSQH